MLDPPTSELQMDYVAAWLALAAPPDSLRIAAAAATASKYPPEALADKHWARRWADLQAVLAELGEALPSGRYHDRMSEMREDAFL